MKYWWVIFVCGILLTSCARVQTTALSAAVSSQAAEVTASASAAPVEQLRLKDGVDEPTLTAEAVAVYDVLSKQFVYTKNADKRLMPASTTKMMTMLVSLESYNPNEVITISRAAEAIGHAVDIKAGDQVRVMDVIKALMVNSGNDTAVSLADHFPSGYGGFVNAMNVRAQALGMKNTHFSNVSGVEADDHYSSARDLALLGAFVMEREDVRQIVSIKRDSIATVDNKHRYALENLNELLWDVQGVVGIKTGWTPVAGDCLVTYVDREKDIITVVLKSEDRFADSKTLIEWAYDSIDW